MVSRHLLPGIMFLAVAFVFSFLVSISLPYLTALDIVRIDFGNLSQSGADQTRLGIWGICTYVDGARKCAHTGHGYIFFTSIISKGGIDIVTIGSSWTRGLAVHPVATVAVLVALVMSFSAHTVVASMVAFLAALLTLIAFATDIALYAYVHHKFHIFSGVNTNTGPGFWLTFVSLILLLLAGCTVWFGRRRESSGAYGDDYPMSNMKRVWPFKRS